jgi:hypothetical protein
MRDTTHTYSVKFEPQPEYLHCIVTGRNTRDNVLRYLQDILRECLARDSRTVLIEERLEGPRLGTLDVFDIASHQGKPLTAPIRAIAFVDVNRDGKLLKFAEDVAVNRAIPVKMFESVAEAQHWLRARHRAAS